MNNKLEELKQSRHSGKQKCLEIFDKMCSENGNSIHRAYLALFKKLKTGEGSQYLIGHYERDLGSKWECLSKSRFGLFYALTKKRFVSLTLAFLRMLAKTGFYMVDIIKDVRFIFLLVPLVPHSMPLLAIAIWTLIGSEVVKMLHLFTVPADSTLLRVVRSLVWPLLPAFGHHKEFVLKSRYNQLASKRSRSAAQEREMADVRADLNFTLALKGELRAIETVIEHFIQVILSISVLFLKDYGNTLKEEDMKFVFVSAGISMLSIVHGQIKLISTRKNGHLGIYAQILLVFYLVVAIAPRGYLLFCSLRFGFSLSNAPDNVNFIFVNLPIIMTAVVVLLLHIGVSHAIQTEYFKQTRKTVVQGLWTFLAPPLFLDWDTLYEQEDYKVSIKTCWRRSMIVVVLHNILTFCGNVAICVSLLMKKDFESEGESIYSLIVPMTVSPVLLISLSILYFKRFHPWARVLRGELSGESAVEETSGEIKKKHVLIECGPILGRRSNSAPDLAHCL